MGRLCHRLLSPALVAVLVAACVAASLHGWRNGQPVPLPDAPSERIACASYTPFRKPGETPFDKHAHVPRERIEADLEVLSQRFECVRTYSVSQGLAEVPAVAERLGMKVLLGIWIGRDPAENEREVALGLRVANAHPATVRAVIVGNEVLLRRELPPERLRAYIERVRGATHLPVTYADVWEFWLRHQQLSDAVSFVTIHILPYWEDDPVDIDRAVDHVRRVYEQVREVFAGKEVLIGEIGWPSKGRSRRGAVPSRVNEARFIREFLSFATTFGVPYNVIEAVDQPWKRRLEGTVGGHWGLYDAELRPKFPLQGPVTEDPTWMKGVYAGIGLAVAFALAPLAGARRPGLRGLLILALAGYATGTALAAQIRHMAASNRDAFEWALSATFTALAVFTAFLSAWALARWADGRGRQPPLVPASLLELQRLPRSMADWLGLLRFVWLFAAATVALLLTFDARYRDFPLSLFGAPGLGFLLLALAGAGDPRAWRPVEQEERLLAGWLAVSAPLIVAFERIANTSAVLWGALSLALAAAVLVPHVAARRRSGTPDPGEHQGTQ
ncbi:hypothetical protein [Pelomicrobium methylotrophicum]|uniref:glycoside hydrolase family 17 protein n=1 Tax=Pelomicrobium methylotrophicum TaxID=2602750 RepID=UPI001969DE0A|nr:hypothetical protein [Pelomicrobium methylotrophicum]